MALDLDIEQESQLIAYLQATHRLSIDEQPSIRVFTGGVSNRTVLVERAGHAAFVLKQALEKLRVDVDWYSNPDRIFREAAALRALEQLLPLGSTPNFLFEDTAARLFAMTAIPEDAENWKHALLAGRIDAPLVRSFGALLGTLHRSAYERDGTLHLSREFGDRTLFESLRVEPYYLYAAEREPNARPFLFELVNEVRAHALTLVHGDYSPKNILVENGRLVLLDYEVTHWGDPAFDVGFGLTHLLSKAHRVVEHRADFAEATRVMWQCYRFEIDGLPWSRNLEARVVRNTIGCLFARVCGRSPLEYLTVAQKAAQRYATLKLMASLPTRIDDLVDEFLEHI